MDDDFVYLYISIHRKSQKYILDNLESQLGVFGPPFLMVSSPHKEDGKDDLSAHREAEGDSRLRRFVFSYGRSVAESEQEGTGILCPSLFRSPLLAKVKGDTTLRLPYKLEVFLFHSESLCYHINVANHKKEPEKVTISVWVGTNRQMKQILLIMPSFFDYPAIVQEELKNMGYSVDYFDDRPSKNGFVKAAIRLNSKLIIPYVRRYFNRIMKTISGKKYDFVLMISGMSLSFTPEMISELKKSQSQAKFVLYQWDSIHNYPRIKKIYPYFEKIFSFDDEDCRNNKNMSFLPLFYSRRYEEIGTTIRKDYKYDICFIGTAHPKKYQFVKQIHEQLLPVYKNQFIYFFFPSRLVYVYRKIKNYKIFRHAKYKEFHFTPIKGKEMDELFSESQCILDSPQDGQRGLTMRTIETLGAKRKLITTNANIRNYDFYRPENIYIYDGAIDLDNVFFKSPYLELPKEIYEKYSLRSWLKTVLN